MHRKGSLDESEFYVRGVLSRTGCLITMRMHVEVGSIVSIGISGIGKVDAQIVRRSDDLHGCSFLQAIEQQLVDAAEETNTVVKLPGDWREPTIGLESTMPRSNRWSRRARTAVLVAGSVGSWAYFGSGAADGQILTFSKKNKGS